jgi:LPS export ABC transporter protein LptC
VSTAGRLRLKTQAGRLLLAALVATAGVGVLWYRGLDHGQEPAPPPEVAEGSSRAEMVTRDFRHVETRMDRTIWVLEARKAEVQEDKARLNTVRITWYGEPGSVPMVITSDSGRVDFGKRSAVLNGNVRLAREDGAVLETERLAWDEARKLLQAPGDVLITTPTFSFRGTSLIANVERQWVKLNGQVRGEIRGGVALSSSPS